MSKKNDSFDDSSEKPGLAQTESSTLDRSIQDNTPSLRLGEILKKEMKAKGLTISNLSKDCGISRTTIHNWIQGIGPSSNNIPVLVKLCLYFDISLEYLLFGMEFSRRMPTDKNDLDGIVYQGTYEDRGELFSIFVKKLKSPN
jgi:transcriptional regulator with XRE-family HTH domain